jgi:hypothetical protein
VRLCSKFYDNKLRSCLHSAGVHHTEVNKLLQKVTVTGEVDRTLCCDGSSPRGTRRSRGPLRPRRGPVPGLRRQVGARGLPEERGVGWLPSALTSRSPTGSAMTTLSRTWLGYGQGLGRYMGHIMAGWMQPSRWLSGTTKGQAQATPKGGEQTEGTSSSTSRLRPPLSRSPSPVSLALSLSLIPCCCFILPLS